jgi:hypothetical protein
MTPSSKINLVYVASIGRSGTTLLESMLGAHPSLETTGELHLWPHEIMMGGVQRCGSGEYVQNCPFWTEMRSRVDPLRQAAPQLHFFREQHNGGKTLRPTRLWEFGTNRLHKKTNSQVRQYGENNEAIFRTFADLVDETTGRRPMWIVDASKDPYRLLWLQRSGLFNIKVIHMVKNPRGYIYSAIKHWLKVDDPLRALKRHYYTSRQALAWVIQNRLISAVAEHYLSSDNYLLLQYEDLASSPEETFAAVCEMIGVTHAPEAVHNFREGSHFTIAGNPMRYENRGIILDETWKRRLPSSSRCLSDLVTSTSMEKYGYQ